MNVTQARSHLGEAPGLRTSIVADIGDSIATKLVGGRSLPHDQVLRRIVKNNAITIVSWARTAVLGQTNEIALDAVTLRSAGAYSE